VESKLGPLGNSATSGLLYLPLVIVSMENLVEWRLVGETEVLGENLTQRHFVHHKSHLTILAVGVTKIEPPVKSYICVLQLQEVVSTSELMTS
jgi:hypothetical protein